MQIPNLPNLSELQRRLPEIAGILVTIITLLGGIIAAASDAGSSLPGQNGGGTTPPSSSAPTTSPKSAYLVDYYYEYAGQSIIDTEVTYNGKDYPHSIISTSATTYDVKPRFNLNGQHSRLTFKVAFSDDVKPTADTGVVEVRVGEGVRERVTVKRGESVDVTVDVRGANRVQIQLWGVKAGYEPESPKGYQHSNGLSILTPVLK